MEKPFKCPAKGSSWVMKFNNIAFKQYEEFPVWDDCSPMPVTQQDLSNHFQNNPGLKVFYSPIGHTSYPPIISFKYNLLPLNFKIKRYSDLRFITACGIKGFKGYTCYNPIDTVPDLFRIFAALNPDDDEAIMEFVKQYGPLSFTGKDDFIPCGEIISEDEEVIRYYRIRPNVISKSINPYVYTSKNMDITGYHHLTVYKDNKHLDDCWWFEPLEWFKNELKKFKELYNLYLKLKKLELTTKQEQRDGNEYDWKQWLKKGKIKLTLLRRHIKSRLNYGLTDANYAIQVNDDEEFTPGFEFNTLYHALYIQLYNAAVGNRLGICATPGCNKVFWKTRSDQLHCSRQCGSRARASKCYNKKKTLRAESD